MRVRTKFRSLECGPHFLALRPSRARGPGPAMGGQTWLRCSRAVPASTELRARLDRGRSRTLGRRWSCAAEPVALRSGNPGHAPTSLQRSKSVGTWLSPGPGLQSRARGQDPGGREGGDPPGGSPGSPQVLRRGGAAPPWLPLPSSATEASPGPGTVRVNAGRERPSAPRCSGRIGA